jgi:hypothetical protein
VFLDNKKHEFLLSFYNNDFSKKYKLRIEGIDAEGKLIYYEKVF